MVELRSPKPSMGVRIPLPLPKLHVKCSFFMDKLQTYIYTQNKYLYKKGKAVFCFLFKLFKTLIKQIFNDFYDRKLLNFYKKYV